MLASILAQAAAPTVNVQSKNPIFPSGAELIWGTLSFLILFVVMWKFAFPAVQNGMRARTEHIRQNLDSAQHAKDEAQTVLEEYQRQLADAKNESNRIIEEARQTADQLRRDLMARAEAEATELRQRAAADIEAAKDRALADMRTSIASLAIEAAELIVERNLDRQTNTALVESYISRVGAQSR